MLSHWGHRSGKAEADCTPTLFSLLCAPWFLSPSFSSFSPLLSLSPFLLSLPACQVQIKKYFYPEELRINQLPIILQWPSENLLYTDEQNKKVLEKGTARAQAARVLGSPFPGPRGCDWEPPLPLSPACRALVPKAFLWHLGIVVPLGNQNKGRAHLTFSSFQ
jgi:hypothetical protein